MNLIRRQLCCSATTKSSIGQNFQNVFFFSNIYMLNESLAKLCIQKELKLPFEYLFPYILYTGNRSIQKPWQKEVLDMSIVIIDYLMQIINPLGKITMFWAKTFLTNTSNNQTVLKSIEYTNQNYNLLHISITSNCPTLPFVVVGQYSTHSRAGS